MKFQFQRRNRIDLMTPAELAIREAVRVVEEAGADVRLTRAVVLLGQAQAAVADFVDGVPGVPLPGEPGAALPFDGAQDHE